MKAKELIFALVQKSAGKVCKWLEMHRLLFCVVRKSVQAHEMGGLEVSCWKKSAQVIENRGADFASVAECQQRARCGRGGRRAAKADSFVREMNPANKHETL
jgi:hypothetical protein